MFRCFISSILRFALKFFSVSLFLYSTKPLKPWNFSIYFLPLLNSLEDPIRPDKLLGNPIYFHNESKYDIANLINLLYIINSVLFKWRKKIAFVFVVVVSTDDKEKSTKLDIPGTFLIHEIHCHIRYWFHTNCRRIFTKFQDLTLNMWRINRLLQI